MTCTGGRLAAFPEMVAQLSVPRDVCRYAFWERRFQQSSSNSLLKNRKELATHRRWMYACSSSLSFGVDSPTRSRIHMWYVESSRAERVLVVVRMHSRCRPRVYDRSAVQQQSGCDAGARMSREAVTRSRFVAESLSQRSNKSCRPNESGMIPGCGRLIASRPVWSGNNQSRAPFPRSDLVVAELERRKLYTKKIAW